MVAQHSIPRAFSSSGPAPQALLSWQDPTATFLVLVALSAVAALILLLGPATVLAAVLCFLIRPPALRTPTPALPAVFFGRLPTRADRIV